MERTFSDTMVMVVSLVIAVAGTIDRLSPQEKEESPPPKAKLPADLVHKIVEDLRLGEQGWTHTVAIWVHKDLTVWIDKDERTHGERDQTHCVLVKCTEHGYEVVIHKSHGEYPTWRPKDLEKNYGLFSRKRVFPAVKVTKASD